MTIDADAFRSVLGRFASGITIVTARDADGRRSWHDGECVLLGEPRPGTRAHLRRSRGFDAPAAAGHPAIGVSVLSADQEPLSRRFAAIDSEGRFDGLGYSRGESGLVLLDDVLAHLECRVTARHEAGDHTIFIAEVDRADARDGGAPAAAVLSRWLRAALAVTAIRQRLATEC